MICVICGKTDCTAYDTIIVGDAVQDLDGFYFNPISVRIGLCDEHVLSFKYMPIDERDELLKSRMEGQVRP